MPRGSCQMRNKCILKRPNILLNQPKRRLVYNASTSRVAGRGGETFG